jgi:HEAT repeat protein
MSESHSIPTLPGEERAAKIALGLHHLQSPDPLQRAEGARLLGNQAAEPDALTDALQDPSALVRAAAVDGLANLEPVDLPAAAPDLLMALIDDPNDYVCAATVRALGRLMVIESIPQVRDCLDDPNPHISAAAMRALGRMGDLEAAPRLLEALSGSNPLVQTAAVGALAALQVPQAAPILLQMLSSLLRPTEGTPQPHNERLLVALIQALGMLNYKEAVPVLVEVARSEVGLRSRAVQALLTLDASSAAPSLAYLLVDPSTQLRASLIELMIATRYPSALPLIRPLLKDKVALVRDRALTAMAVFHDVSSIPQVLWMCLHDPGPFTRVKAVNVLVSLAGAAALPDLLDLTGDLNVAVRRAVTSGLGLMVSPAGGLQAPAWAALSHLAQSDPDPEVVEIARLGLERSRPGGELADTALSPSVGRTLFPPDLQPVIDRLRSDLGRWQEYLPAAIRPDNLEEIARLDQALIALLKELDLNN